MRTPPMMRIEVDGQTVRRPGVLDVLLHDRLGNPVITRMRPQLLDGERLLERAGQIPAVVREAA